MAFQEYSGKNCKVSFLGKPAVLTSVKYELKRKSENKYVMGMKDPYATVRGNKEYSGEVKMYQSQFESLQRTLADGDDITDIEPFDITVIYLSTSGLMVTDVLENCTFTGVSKEMKATDESMEIALPINIQHITFNKK